MMTVVLGKRGLRDFKVEISRKQLGVWSWISEEKCGLEISFGIRRARCVKGKEKDGLGVIRETPILAAQQKLMKIEKKGVLEEREARERQGHYRRAT